MSQRAVLPLMLAVLALLSCVSQPEARLHASLSHAAWYEEQLEEGFGHLDRLPRN